MRQAVRRERRATTRRESSFPRETTTRGACAGFCVARGGSRERVTRQCHHQRHVSFLVSAPRVVRRALVRLVQASRRRRRRALSGPPNGVLRAAAESRKHANVRRSVATLKISVVVCPPRTNMPGHLASDNVSASLLWVAFFGRTPSSAGHAAARDAHDVGARVRRGGASRLGVFVRPQPGSRPSRRLRAPRGAREPSAARVVTDGSRGARPPARRGGRALRGEVRREH